MSEPLRRTHVGVLPMPRKKKRREMKSKLDEFSLEPDSVFYFIKGNCQLNWSFIARLEAQIKSLPLTR